MDGEICIDVQVFKRDFTVKMVPTDYGWIIIRCQRGITLQWYATNKGYGLSRNVLYISFGNSICNESKRPNKLLCVCVCVSKLFFRALSESKRKLAQAFFVFHWTKYFDFASTIQLETQNNTWRHERVGQPGPWIILLTHVKNSTVTVILRIRHSRTRKKARKKQPLENRDHVTPSYALASPLG